MPDGNFAPSIARGPSAVATPEIDALIDAGAPVCIGVSGGKDSQSCAIATQQYLKDRGHAGELILVHSDLGVVEWNDSLPACERLARDLGVELLVVRRAAGDMMDRWEARWASSMQRYSDLSTVTLVLPWSTPSMRFCTSELKTALIGSALRKRYGKKVYINATGIRREESTGRSRAPIAKLQSNGRAWDWNPIVEWTTEQVFAAIAAAGMVPHEAYSRYGMSRVSCRFCIMSSLPDLKAAAAAPESQDLYIRMVGLELASTFGFQGGRYLCDIAPQLLPEAMRDDIERAKAAAKARQAAEARKIQEMQRHGTKGGGSHCLAQASSGVAN